MRTHPQALAVCLGFLVPFAASGAMAQRCPAPLPLDVGTPPTSINPVILRVLGGAIMPVAATDGLVHLAYAAQVTNLAAGVAEIGSIVPVDPLQRFQPTGRNWVRDVDAKPITGKVRLFGLPPDAARDLGKVPPAAPASPSSTSPIPT